MPNEIVTNDQRRQFDSILEDILDGLPERIHELLEVVPLVVDDYPPPRLLEELASATALACAACTAAFR